MVCGGPLGHLWSSCLWRRILLWWKLLNLVAGMGIKDVSVSCIFAILETHNSNSNVSLFLMSVFECLSYNKWFFLFIYPFHFSPKFLWLHGKCRCILFLNSLFSIVLELLNPLPTLKKLSSHLFSFIFTELIKLGPQIIRRFATQCE